MNAEPENLNKKQYDIIIHRATIYDGTGSDGFVADIGILGEKIIKILPHIPEKDSKVNIDAKGLTLSPGFIDVHTHADVSVFQTPSMEPKIQQGVTTIIIGNCGFGISPKQGSKKHNYFVMETDHDTPWESFKDYIEEASTLPLEINVGALSGHGTIRTFATNEDNPQNLSSTALDRMYRVIDEELSEGSFGVSFGLAYAPGRFSKTEELIEVANIVKKHDAICTYHMRDEGRFLLTSVEEVLEVAQRSGVRSHISHFKALGEDHKFQAYNSFIKIMEARQKGIPMSLDCYPYISGVTALREAMAWKIFEKGHQMCLNMPLENIKIACSCKHPELNGLNMKEVATKFNVSHDEVFQKLLKEDEYVGILLMGCLSEKIMQYVISHPATIIASDSIPLIRKGEKLHPRLYGTFPHVLSKYTRIDKALELKSAIKKMTGLPAEIFKIKDRGIIKEGYFADIVLFDAEKIEDKATYENPEQFPEGICMVFVNGKLALNHKKILAVQAGKAVKRNS